MKGGGKLFLDTDVLYGYFVPEDWLHETAEKVIDLIRKRKIKVALLLKFWNWKFCLNVKLKKI